MNENIRWKQRYKNLQRAYDQLKNGLAIKDPNETERQGIIKSFEFTFELAWKTLKDYLEDKGVSVSFPRDVIKESFRHDIVSDGEIWLDMLENRNLLAHTYDEKKANEACLLIRASYEPAIAEVISFLDKNNK